MTGPSRSPGVPDVSVAIPVRDGGELFGGVLRALATQTVEHELVICDSGSTDGSGGLARDHGARVIDMPGSSFSHGGVRNTLMVAATGAHVALLTQDAEPADARWLERLLEGFRLAGDVAIVYGSYRPRPDAPPAVRLELERWFTSLSLDRVPQVERLDEDERSLPALELIGRRGFFTDANACIARTAWEEVPFRDVTSAEDRVLAMDMLRHGYAKAYVPEASVIHSHYYTGGEQLRRCFDEWRGLREVYGWREPASPARLVGQLRGAVGHARRELIREGVPGRRRRATLAAVGRHQLICLTGALLGSRAGLLPAGARRRLSLEGRGGFAPLQMNRESASETRTAQPNER
jgi:glycosyltransferase involved in cell wall biosynthesis